MTKPPDVLLRHVLECIELIQSYTVDADRDRFLDDRQLQDAVIRRLEIIGEAVKNLPDDLRQSHPEVPWRQIVQRQIEAILQTS